MKSLLTFLNGLPPADQAAFARRCKTTVGYLRKAISVSQPLRGELCINIERESDRRVLCEQLRPDVDWAYLRGTLPVANTAGPVGSQEPAVNDSAGPPPDDPAGQAAERIAPLPAKVLMESTPAGVQQERAAA